MSPEPAGWPATRTALAIPRDNSALPTDRSGRSSAPRPKGGHAFSSEEMGRPFGPPLPRSVRTPLLCRRICRGGKFYLVRAVSAAMLQCPFSSQSLTLRSLRGRPGRSGSLRSIDLQSPSLSHKHTHTHKPSLYLVSTSPMMRSESMSTSLNPKQKKSKEKKEVLLIQIAPDDFLCLFRTRHH